VGAPAGVPAGAASAPRSTAPGVDPFVYFVQAGAFTRTEDAEQQRAKLAMMGYTAKVTEREQSGRVVYRVRMGPYPSRDQADALQVRLQEAAVESQIVRVEKP
jgi:cell division protein FtsN